MGAEDGKPQRFIWQRTSHHITAVSACWRVHTAWWREAEIWRDYWDVVTDTGFFCTLFRDLHDDAWYLERVYE